MSSTSTTLSILCNFFKNKSVSGDNFIRAGDVGKGRANVLALKQHWANVFAGVCPANNEH